MPDNFQAKPINSTNGGTFRNINLTPKTQWEYQDENYLTEAAADKRIDDMEKRFWQILAMSSPELVAKLNPDLVLPKQQEEEKKEPEAPSIEDRWDLL